MEDWVRTPAPIGNFGSGIVTPTQIAESGRILSRQESGSGRTTPKNGYNMLDVASDAMVDSSEKRT